jgi:hypothetical protein
VSVYEAVLSILGDDEFTIDGPDFFIDKLNDGGDFLSLLRRPVEGDDDVSRREIKDAFDGIVLSFWRFHSSTPWFWKRGCSAMKALTKGASMVSLPIMAALMSIPIQSWLMVLGRPCEM